jgi:hypothetical protein
LTGPFSAPHVDPDRDVRACDLVGPGRFLSGGAECLFEVDEDDDDPGEWFDHNPV